MLLETKQRRVPSVSIEHKSLLIGHGLIRCAAIKIGVPVVPGTPGAVEKYTDAAGFVKEYGFPG